MKKIFGLLFLFSATFSLASCGGNKEPEPENYYTITWKNDDGSTLSTTEVKEGEMPVYDKGTPTKQATVAETFTFDCWTPKVVRATQDTTYTATYSSTKNKYMVSWYSEDVLLHVELLEYGSTPTYHWANKPTKAETDRKRYDWNGWKETITTVTGDTDYHAHFDEVNKYLITFKNEDGTTLQESYVAADELPSYDGTPTKPADAQYTYTFSGWDKKVEMPTADTIYTATYSTTVNKYLITWVNDDGKTLFSESLEYGETPVYKGAPPAKPGDAQYTYTFAGWSPTIVEVTGVATYTATYTSTTNKYTITWKNYDDSTLYSEDVAYGTTPTYKGTTPTKPTTAAETFTFSGWSPTIVEVTGAATYTATFTSSVTKHTISWYNGTTLLHSEELEYGATPSYHWEDKPTKVETDRKRYDWNGWEETIATVTGPASYHAHFDEVNKYLITFKNEDGTPLQETYVAADEMPSYPGTPTKSPDAQYTYTFAGWDKEVVKPTEDTTYIATYTSTTNKYTISWYNGDTLLHSEELAYGATPSYHWEDKPTKAETDRKKYDWNGWEETIVTVTGPASYHAHFDEVNKYLITFKNYDEEVLQQSYVASDTLPSYEGTPTKPADAQYTYTFAGWDKKVVKPTEDTTYTATYTHTTNKYLISWYNGDTLLHSEELAYGTTPSYHWEDKPTKAETDRKRYDWNGWEETIVSVTGKADYHAHFDEVNKYLITYVNWDGTELQKSYVASGSMPSYTGATPTKPADAQYTYAFEGWDKVEEYPTCDTTYTATYSHTTNKYLITWKNDNGDILFSENVAYGTVPEYEGATPTKEATAAETFTFKGWSPEVVAVTSDATYTATYTSTTNKYTITWKNYDGSTLSQEDVAYGTTPIYKGETPTKPETAAETFAFAGWSPTVETVTGAATYIATYTSTTREYKITWKGGINGDEVLKVETLAYGSTPIAPTDVPSTLTDDVYEYTFLNTWSPVVTKVTGEATYVAQYSQKLRNFNITWENWDGTLLQSDSVTYGVTPSYSGVTPTKSINGHVFEWIGWDKEILPVTKAETYQAIFDNDITFDFEGINCTINGKDEFTDVYTFGELDSIEYVIKPNGVYELPDTISVYIDDVLVSSDKYTYNKTTGVFSIASNLGNIRLEVTGV